MLLVPLWGYRNTFLMIRLDRQQNYSFNLIWMSKSWRNQILLLRMRDGLRKLMWRGVSSKDDSFQGKSLRDVLQGPKRLEVERQWFVTPNEQKIPNPFLTIPKVTKVGFIDYNKGKGERIVIEDVKMEANKNYNFFSLDH